MLISFPNTITHQPWAAWVCFVPLFMCLRQIKLLPIKIIVSWVVWQVFFVALFGQPLRLSFDDYFPTQSIGLLLFYTVFPILYGLLTACIQWIIEQKPSLIGCAIASSVWCLFETIVLPTMFKFPLSLAITQYQQTTLIQGCNIFGITWISVLILSVNIAQTIAISRKNGTPLLLLLSIVLINYGYGATLTYQKDIPAKNTITFLTLQPNKTEKDIHLFQTNPNYFKDQLSDIDHLVTKGIHAYHPDMVLIPEGMFTDQLFSTKLFPHATKLFNAWATPFIFHTSQTTTNTHQLSNSSIFYQNNAIDAYSSKHHTLPYVEALINTRDRNTALFNVPVIDQHHQKRLISIGSLICFDSCFNDRSRQYKKRLANGLVYLANTSFFTNKNWIFLQRAYLPFRSVETNLPSVYVNNRGGSLNVSSTGKIIDSTPLHQRGISRMTVNITSSKPPIYTSFPHLLTTISSFLLLFLFLFPMLKKGGEKIWHLVK